MTKQSTPSRSLQTTTLQPAVVFAAFFEVIATDGLATLSLEHIAATLHTPLTVLRQHYPTVGHILTAFHTMVGAEMQAAISYDSQDLKRDVYFDLIMARLDALQPYRDGMRRFIKELPARPDLALLQALSMRTTINQMIEAADDYFPAWQLPLKKAGLLALCLHVLKAWSKDDSSDLAKTMATLDQSLERAEYWVTKLASKAA